MQQEFNKKSIEISFRKFMDFSSDLLNSNHNTFDTRLKIFMNHCENDSIMKNITTQLKNVDSGFDEWWSNGMKTGGSFSGSKEFNLPVDEVKRDVFLYDFLLRILEGRINLVSFSSDFLAQSEYDNLNDYINYFNDAITLQLVRSIGYKLEEILNEIELSYSDKVNIPNNVLFVYNDSSIKIGDKNKFNGDTSIGGGKVEKKKT